MLKYSDRGKSCVCVRVRERESAYDGLALKHAEVQYVVCVCVRERVYVQRCVMCVCARECV